MYSLRVVKKEEKEAAEVTETTNVPQNLKYSLYYYYYLLATYRTGLPTLALEHYRSTAKTRNTVRRSNTELNGIPEREEIKGTEKKDKNFLELIKSTSIKKSNESQEDH